MFIDWYFFISNFSPLNVLIVNKPFNVSRVRKFNCSSNFCNFNTWGVTINKRTTRKIIIKKMLIIIEKFNNVFVVNWVIFIIPNGAITKAKIRFLKPILKVFWIWAISDVDRVIRLDIEYFWKSFSGKAITFFYNTSRIWLAIWALMRAEK